MSGDDYDERSGCALWVLVALMLFYGCSTRSYVEDVTRRVETL